MGDLLDTPMPWGQYRDMPLRQVITTKYGREFVWLTYERMKDDEPLDPLVEALGAAVEAAKEYRK